MATKERLQTVCTNMCWCACSLEGGTGAANAECGRTSVPHLPGAASPVRCMTCCWAATADGVTMRRHCPIIAGSWPATARSVPTLRYDFIAVVLALQCSGVAVGLSAVESCSAMLASCYNVRCYGWALL